MTRTRARDIAGAFRGSAAIAEGIVTAKLLRGPMFRRLFRDVYVPSGTETTHALRCRAAALALVPSAIISGRSAATLRGVELARPDDPVEVVVPLETRIARRCGVDVRRSALLPSDSTPWGGIGLATPLRTAVDLALDRPLPDAVADLDAVLRDGLVDRPDLARELGERHDRGIVAARRAEELADPRAESRPESRLRVHLLLAGLAPEPQVVVRHDGAFVARVDLAFEAERVAVEYDGEWHQDPRAAAADRERINRLQAAGWTVIVVTAREMRDPAAVVATVHAALAARRRSRW